jgi:3-dehydroquinate synthase
MPSVRVALGPRAYDLEIGSNTLPCLGQFITQRLKLSHAIVITDEQVESLYAETVLKSLAPHGRIDLLSVPAGESSKSLDYANLLWEKFLEFGADRKTIVIALGGGVVGDLAGFVAASFTRGLNFIQVPTTLLAQVDSSVGGKTGINLSSAKNMVGAFWQPRGVLIDTAVLQTQTARDYRCGLAEVVKYGVILDAEFFADLEENVEKLNSRDEEYLAQVVARCCELKAQVVCADEREETGLRAILNYGHTFAHAFEAVAGYGEILHGEAVAMGMTCAARLAMKLGRVDAAFCARQQQLLQALELPVQVPQLNHAQLLEAMSHDKKVEHGQLRFILPSKLGHVELVGNIPMEVVAQVFAE